MKKRTKIMGTAILMAAMTMMASTGTNEVMASSMHLGNNSANIMNGGILSEVIDGVTYFANTEDGNRLYREEDGEYTRLSAHGASQINVLDDKIYYVTNENTVMCYDLSTDVEYACFSVEAGIDEMYVNHAGHVYYLSEGNIYEKESVETDSSVYAEEQSVKTAANALTEAEAVEAAEVTAEPSVEQTEEENVDESSEASAENEESEALTESSEEEIPSAAEEETETEESETEEVETEEEQDAVLIMDAQKDIVHFVPTTAGMIYAVGYPLDYTLYAEDSLIVRHVTGFYTAGNYLVLNQDGEDLQASFGDLFDGNASDALVEYDPENAPVDYSLGEDNCELCAENADKAAAGVELEDDWDLVADAAEALVNDDDAGIAASNATSDIHRMLYDSSTSEGQRNIVKRAYQMHLVSWTPLANITGWGPGSSTYTFTKGTTYTGLPYGQPVNNSGYVPWNVSLETFVKAVNTAGSVMYTSYSSYNTRAPYYSTDCSGFVSYAWETDGRKYTGNIGGSATTLSSQSIYNLQIGDAFLKTGSHIAMVSDIGMRDGTMVYVDVIEQTPPKTRLTRYGEGGSYTLAYLSTKYLSKGYVIIRSKTRDNVSYTPSSVVAVDDDEAGTITPNATTKRLDIGDTYTITYTTEDVGDYSVSWSSSNTKVATVSGGKVTAVGTGRAYVTVSIGPASARVLIEVRPATVTGFDGKGIANGSIKLTWNAVSGAGKYVVYRLNSSNSWEAVGETTNTYFYDTGADLTAKKLAKHTTYTYTVIAVYTQTGYANMNGHVCSSIKRTTVTNTPTLTGIGAVSYTSQKLVWNAVDGAEAYRVYAKVTGAKSWTFLGETKSTSYVNANLTAGTSYTYTVTAYFVENDTKIISAYDSNGITRVCCTATPSLTSVKALSTSSQQVTWKAVSGASGYVVYYKAGNASAWTRLGATKTTSYTQQNLKLGTKYTYTVRAYRTVAGKNVYSGYQPAGISKVCCPATPVLRSVTTVDSSTQKLTWNAVSGAAGYYVYRKEGTTGKWTNLGAVTGTTYTSQGLTLGVTYVYTVRAYAKSGSTTILSDYDTAGISRKCTFPAVTLNAIAANNSTTQTVSWTAMPGASEYYVYVKAGDETKWTRLGVATGTSYKNENLTTGIKYTYTVRAAATVDGSTLLGEYSTAGISRMAVPRTVSLKTLSATSYTSQTLTWTAVDDVDGYDVYRKTGSNGSWVNIGSTTETSYRSVGLTCGETYTYTVRAYKLVDGTKVRGGFDSTGLSKVCIPATPMPEEAKVSGSRQVTVSWNGVSGAQSYLVYRKTAGTSWSRVATTKSLSYTDTDLTPGETYIYTMRAIRQVSGKNIYSDFYAKGVSCTVDLDKTELISAERTEDGNVVVTWNPVDFADGYNIYCKEVGGSWTVASVIKNAETGTVTLTDLDSSKDYVIRVRAFWNLSNGKTYKGPDDVNGITVEKQ